MMGGNKKDKDNAAIYRDIEEQKLQEFRDSVVNLKELSQAISDHLSDEQHLTDKMNNNYSAGQLAMKNVISKIDDVLKSGGASRTTCYLVGIIVVFFFIMFLIK